MTALCWVLWTGPALAGQSWRPLAGGVLSADDRVGFFAAVPQGLEAVSMATGQVLWRAEGALVPLVGFDGGVLARSPDSLVAFSAAGESRTLLALDLPDAAPCYVALEGPRLFLALDPHRDGLVEGHADLDAGEWVALPRREGRCGPLIPEPELVGLSLGEEGQVLRGEPGQACHFHGELVVDDADTGAELWRRPVVHEAPCRDAQ